MFSDGFTFQGKQKVVRMFLFCHGCYCSSVWLWSRPRDTSLVGNQKGKGRENIRAGACLPDRNEGRPTAARRVRPSRGGNPVQPTRGSGPNSTSWITRCLSARRPLSFFSRCWRSYSCLTTMIISCQSTNNNNNPSFYNQTTVII